MGGYAAAGAASLLIPLYAPGSGAFLVGLMASTAAFAGVPGALAAAALVLAGTGLAGAARLRVCGSASTVRDAV